MSMGGTIGRVLFVLVLLAGIAIGAFYVLSPRHALRELQQASVASDTERVEYLVDLAALKRSMNAEIRGRMEETDDGEEPGALQRVGTNVTMALAGPLIDTAVSPERIAWFIRESSKQAGGQGAGEDWDIDYEDHNSFVARRISSDESKGVALRFSRECLGWKLAGIELP